MPFENTCMGIYQFTDKAKQIFNTVIRPLVGAHTGLTYVDATYYYESSEVKMALIAKMIESANLVIADLSEKNVNVFFELGIAFELNKPMVLICSREAFHKADIWDKKMPFDIKGRELLIFDDENDLKVKLGQFISDALYQTKQVTVSWLSRSKDNHIKSPYEIEIHSPGMVSSNQAINSNFILSCHVKIHAINEAIAKKESYKNPDVRLYFSSAAFGCPGILIIFPWELSETDRDKYECHIDYVSSQDPIKGERLQQVAVVQRDFATIKDFNILVSFCWPNLVFEASFFEKRIDRLIYPLSGFRDKGFPIHLPQYIGFESINSRVSIDNIKIKEIIL